MERSKRDKICKTCSHNKMDTRYGILCGLTDNLANFETTCRNYNEAKNLDTVIKHRPLKEVKPKGKKGIGSVIGGGFVIWIIFKMVLKVIRSFSES